MNKLAYFFLVACTVLFLVLAGKPAHAQYGQYGGTPEIQAILIDKMVSKASVAKGQPLEFVDNLSPTDPRFQPGQELFFKIKVKNTSNINLFNVTLKDFIPAFVEPVEGPGVFDEKTRVISVDIGDFEPDQEKTFVFKMKVNGQNDLPADKGLFCLVNKAQAFNDKVSDDDSTQFCIEKQVGKGKVLPASVPSAGPEAGFLLLTGQLIALGTGLLIKRYKAV